MSCMYSLILFTPSGRMGAMAVMYRSFASISVDRLPIIWSTYREYMYMSYLHNSSGLA